ncbi:MAG: protease HtpX [Xanthomonadales bacterium]|nr:protease HtpX [Xanthomonadales bacterium]MCB1611354.1 protease HtpX [Xanthomonadales bacterium]
MSRIMLFLGTNLAVLVMLGLVTNVMGPALGIDPRSTTGLLILAAVVGFTGSFISLALSKWMAKRSTGAVVITDPRSPHERWLVATVARQAQAAGIKMPEVAIYNAPDLNAFATGMNRNNALVAVSTGLLNNMSQDEVEAVLAHEIGHVANGDMVTMALIQGVLNTFVFFLSRVIGQIIDQAIFKRDSSEGRGIGYFMTVIVLEIVFGIIASVIAMWFSRQREFRADAAGAKFAGREKMIAALERLMLNHGQTALPKDVQAFGISGGVGEGLKRLFMTHPPLEERIAALRNY